MSTLHFDLILVLLCHCITRKILMRCRFDEEVTFSFQFGLTAIELGLYTINQCRNRWLFWNGIGFFYLFRWASWWQSWGDQLLFFLLVQWREVQWRDWFNWWYSYGHLDSLFSWWKNNILILEHSNGKELMLIILNFNQQHFFLSCLRYSSFLFNLILLITLELSGANSITAFDPFALRT